MTDIPTRPIADSAFAMSIYTSAGTWLNLNDKSNYVVAGDSLGNVATSWRKTEVQNPYVEGKFLVHAVKEMVTEDIKVWVSGSSQSLLRDNIDAIVDQFSQLSYQVKFNFGNSQITWNCQTADYSIEMTREYMHAMYVPVKFSVPRFPTVIRSTI